MEESLKKYITKTHFYHLVNGTEDGLIFDKLFFILLLLCKFFERAFLRGLCSKKQTYERLIDEILKKIKMFLCHLVTRTEDGFNFDNCIYSIDNQFYFMKGV